MAGPATGILLRHPLSEEQLTDLEQWLFTITKSPKKRRGMRMRKRAPLLGERGKWGPFWIHDGTWIGLPDIDCSQTCAFYLLLEKELTEQDDLPEEIQEAVLEEQIQLAEYLGYVPEQSIRLSVGCNRPLDHRLLGQMVLLLAERYEGMIDLNGALLPPLKPGRHWEDVTWEEKARSIEELALPGQVYQIVSNELTGAGRSTIWHLADSEWFRAWLHHPHFHLIK